MYIIYICSRLDTYVSVVIHACKVSRHVVIIIFESPNIQNRPTMTERKCKMNYKKNQEAFLSEVWTATKQPQIKLYHYSFRIQRELFVEPLLLPICIHFELYLHNVMWILILSIRAVKSKLWLQILIYRNISRPDN